MKKRDEAQRLSQKLNVVVEDTPFCIGYWMRVANEERPKDNTEQQRGWDKADKENCNVGQGVADRAR